MLPPLAQVHYRTEFASKELSVRAQVAGLFRHSGRQCYYPNKIKKEPLVHIEPKVELHLGNIRDHSITEESYFDENYSGMLSPSVYSSYSPRSRSNSPKPKIVGDAVGGDEDADADGGGGKGGRNNLKKLKSQTTVSRISPTISGEPLNLRHSASVSTLENNKKLKSMSTKPSLSSKPSQAKMGSVMEDGGPSSILGGPSSVLPSGPSLSMMKETSFSESSMSAGGSTFFRPNSLRVLQPHHKVAQENYYAEYMDPKYDEVASFFKEDTGGKPTNLKSLRSMGTMMNMNNQNRGLLPDFNFHSEIQMMERTMKQIREGTVGAKKESPKDDQHEETQTSASPEAKKGGKKIQAHEAPQGITTNDRIKKMIDDKRNLKTGLPDNLPMFKFSLSNTDAPTSMIDVRKLAANCMCLSEGAERPTFEQLLVAYKRKMKAKEEKKRQSQMSPMDYQAHVIAHNIILRNKNSAANFGHEMSQRAPRMVDVFDDAWFNAWLKRKRTFRNRIEHKKTHTRNYKKAQREMREALEAEREANIQRSCTSWFKAIACIKAITEIQHMHGSRELARLRLVHRRKKGSPGRKEKKDGEKEEDEEQEKEDEAKKKERESLARAQQVDFFYALTWCVIKVWRRLYKIRLKKRSAKMILWLFKVVEEENKIRQAVVRFSMVLRSIAPKVQYYLQQKRARVKQMEQVWTKHEDGLLQAHFKRLREGVIKDAQESRKANQEDTALKILESGAGVNWKKFRIPSEVRRDFCTKLYVKRLLAHHDAQKKAFKIFMQVYEQQAEALQFLRGLGADPHQLEDAAEEFGPGESPGLEAEQMEFWMINEQTIEATISDMVNTSYTSWFQHPLFNDDIVATKSSSSSEVHFEPAEAP